MAAHLALAERALHAATLTWDGSAGNAAWSTGSNWTGNANSEPAAGDDVVFPVNIPNANNILLNAGENARTIQFLNNYNLNGGSLTFGAGGGGGVTTAAGTDVTISSLLQGAVGLSKSGAGTLRLIDENTFSGSVNVSAGTLVINHNSRLGSAGNAVFITGGAGGGTLATNGTFTLSRAITFIGGARIDVNNGTVTSTTGFASSSTGTLSLLGGGTLVLNAGTTRSGATLVQNGVVRVAVGAALGSGTVTLEQNARLEIANGINFTQPIALNSTAELRGGGGTVFYSGVATVSNDPGTLVVLNSGAAAGDVLQIGGPQPTYLSGGAGGATAVVAGLGRLTLLSGNNYAGDWRIDSGTLRIGNGLALGSGAAPVVVNNSATFELQSVGFGRDVNLNHGSTLAFLDTPQLTGTHVVAPNAVVTLALRNGGTSLLGNGANDLVGGGGASSINVTSDTPGATLQLPHASGYSGAWTIGPNAAVELGDNAALGAVTSTSMNGAALRTVGGATAVNLGPVALANATTFDLQPGSTVTAGSVTGGSVSLASTLTGGGTLVLTQPGNYVGTWNVDTGKLQITDDAQLGNSAVGSVHIGNGVSNAPALRVSGTTSSTRSISFENTWGGAIEVDAGHTFTHGGALLTGPFYKTGGGTYVRTSASPRTASNAIDDGTLRLTHPGGVGGGSIFIGPAGALELTNVSIPNSILLFNTLRGTGHAVVTGTVNATAGNLQTGANPADTLTVGDSANDLTGTTPNGHINVGGAGTVILPFASTFPGHWGVGSGALRLGHDAALGTGTSTVNMQPGTRLELNGITLARPLLLNAGTIHAIASSTTTGSLQVGGTVTFSSGANPNTVLTIGDTAFDLFSSGPVPTIVVQGSGAVHMPVEANYPGHWHVDSGVLRTSHAAGLGFNASAVTVDSTGTLELANVSLARDVTLTQGALRGTGANAVAAGNVTIGASPARFATLAVNDVLTIGDPNHGVIGNSAQTILINDGVPNRGTVRLAHANHGYAGGWQIESGYLEVRHAQALGTGASDIVVKAAQLDLLGQTLTRGLDLRNGASVLASGATSVGPVAVASGANVALNAHANPANTLSVGAVSGGGGGSVVSAQGQGTIRLTQPGTYAGHWLLQQGTVRLDGGSLGGAAATVEINAARLDLTPGTTVTQNISMTAGATLRAVGGGASSSLGVHTVVPNNPLNLIAESVDDVLTIGDAANDLNSAVVGATTQINVSGLGKVVLPAASNYAGTWNLAGHLEVNTDTALGGNGNVVNLNPGSKLTVGNNSATSRTINAQGGAIAVASSRTYTLNAALGGDAQTFTLDGNGTLVLAAASARTGPTSLTRGFLRAQHAGALGSGDVTVGSTGWLVANNVAIDNNLALPAGGHLRGMGNAALTGAITVGSTGFYSFEALTAGDVLTIGNAPGDLTGGGPAGNGINIEGPGRVVLAHPSSYDGGWSVGPGATLEAAAASHLGAPGGFIALFGGTFKALGDVAAPTRDLAVGFSTSAINTNGFDATFANVSGSGMLTKSAGGTLTVNHLRTATLAVNAGTVVVAPATGGAAGTSNIGSVSVAPAARFDLKDNKLITQSPLGSATQQGDTRTYSGIAGLIQSGFVNGQGDWSGPGIVTTMEAALGGLTTLGSAVAGEVLAFESDTILWGGQTVAMTDTIVMYTHTGDANLDGAVDGGDYAFIDAYIGSAAADAAYYKGDFNYDGFIDGGDYAYIDVTVGSPTMPAGGVAGAGLTAVPEPAGVVALIGLGALGSSRGRRRPRRQ